METRVDLRQAIEKEVLSYMVAVQYDKCRDKLANERATNFTPLPPAEPGISNPAAKSCISLIDYNANDPVPQAGHFLISDSPSGKKIKFFSKYNLFKIISKIGSKRSI